ncbi:hypothetical protein J6590_083949 [Homalodisca vitripennis]|nr:hypothetical protein J6590_083949 [Homalodisca vitripennis]
MGMIKLTSRKRQLYILGVYRTPAGQLEEALSLLSATIEDTKVENHPLIVMGDINVDGLKSDRNNQMLNNTLSSHSISRLTNPNVSHPTSTSVSSIDFICTNLDKEQLTSTVIHAGISDHTAQLCEIKYITTSSLNKKTGKMYKSQTQQKQPNNFLSTIVAIMNTVCPRKIVQQRKRKAPRYVDEEARCLKAIYLTCLRRHELTGAQADKNEMCKAKKDYDMRLKTIKRQAAADHIANAENKSKALWQVINSERGKNCSNAPQPQLNIKGDITTKPLQIANHLN